MKNIVKTVKAELANVKDELTFEKVLIKALHTPGVKVNRNKFLRKELRKYCSEDVVNAAIEMNPAKAGISKEIINKVSKQVINYETTKITALSVATSVPSGPVAIAATGADITSYFAFILRTIQELAYLYGFPQFDLNEDDIDSETMNFLLLFMGVMFGVQGAAAALRKIADVWANQVAKKLANKALMKVAAYRIVKKIAKTIGAQMTKQIFADGVASTIPFLSAGLSGVMTYSMFKPCCMKLRKNMMTYNLCAPEYYSSDSNSNCEVEEEPVITLCEAAKIYNDNYPKEAADSGIISDFGEYYLASHGVRGDFVASDFFIIDKRNGSIKKEPFENIGKYDIPDELIGGPDYNRPVSELLEINIKDISKEKNTNE